MRAYLLFGAAWLVASTLCMVRLRSLREFSYEEPAPEEIPVAVPS